MPPASGGLVPIGSPTRKGAIALRRAVASLSASVWSVALSRSVAVVPVPGASGANGWMSPFRFVGMAVDAGTLAGIGDQGPRNPTPGLTAGYGSTLARGEVA